MNPPCHCGRTCLARFLPHPGEMCCTTFRDALPRFADTICHLGSENSQSPKAAHPRKLTRPGQTVLLWRHMVLGLNTSLQGTKTNNSRAYLPARFCFAGSGALCSIQSQPHILPGPVIACSDDAIGIARIELFLSSITLSTVSSPLGSHHRRISS